MLTEIDVLVCGNSDPGTSGVLSPFAKIDGLYFDPSEEPADFYFQLMKDLKEINKKNGIQFVTCEFDNAHDFYEALKSMEKYADDNITISGTSKEGVYEMVINEDSD